MKANPKVEATDRGHSKLKVIAGNYRSELTMLCAFILLFGYLCVASSVFFTPRNLTNIMSQVSIIAILAIGETFVMLTGGIDLSVGSTLGLSSMMLAIVMTGTGNVALGVVTCIVSGILLGCINGLFVSYLGIPAFIVTLGMQMICRNADYLVSGGHAINKLPEAFRSFASAEVFPGFRLYYLLIILLFVLMGWVLSNTKPGRFTYAIGSNENATRLAGVNTKFYKMLPYIISGLMAGLGGILIASRLGAVDPNYGTGNEMDTLAAVVIGGCAMTGGKGTLFGTAIGVLFMGVMRNGLDIMGVDPYWQGVAVGTIIILALLFDSFSQMNKKKA